MRILCWLISLQEQYIKGGSFARLPPPSLRYRVHGHPRAEGFLKAGIKSSEDIEAALWKIGKDFDSFQDVLDFGCGCGRTLLWFTSRSPSLRLYGTDIDAEAISWCRNNLTSVEFSTNEPLPPLEYPSETFDLVYAISVFTHLNEDFQFRWLNELKRVTRTQGVVLLTVNGRRNWRSLPREDRADIKKRGFKFITTQARRDIFPEWYQDAYHEEHYVLDQYSKYFEVLDYIPRGMNNRQDMVVLRKPL